MKKVCVFTLVLLISFLLTVTAFAAGQTYTLGDTGVQIDIPSDYVVFTRDIADNDPNLDIYGLSKAELLDLLEANDAYLDALSEQWNFEMVVTILDSPLDDFAGISNAELDTMWPFVEAAFVDSGFTINSHEIYELDQAKYLKVYLEQTIEGSTQYVLHYSTVYDNQMIDLSMQPLDGFMHPGEEAAFQEIVDSVQFAGISSDEESAPAASAFVYQDTETGVEFTVPANWSQDSLTEDREVVEVKFTSDLEGGMTITYGKADLLAALTEEEQAEISRSMVDNSFFSAADLALMLGVSEDEFVSETHGGKEYIRYQTTSSVSVFDNVIDITVMNLIRIENGYMYIFSFSGDESSALYQDFTSLVESVTYPSVEPMVEEEPDDAPIIEEEAPSVPAPVLEEEPEPQDESSSSDDELADSILSGLLLSVLVTIGIYSLPIIIYRYGILQHPVEKAKAKKITIIYGVIAFVVMTALIVAINGSGAAGGAIFLWSWVNYKILTSGKKEEEEAPSAKYQSGDYQGTPISGAGDWNAQNAPAANPKSAETSSRTIRYCTHCGQALLEDSLFCRNCGAWIEKDDAQ